MRARGGSCCWNPARATIVDLLDESCAVRLGTEVENKYFYLFPLPSSDLLLVPPTGWSNQKPKVKNTQLMRSTEGSFGGKEWEGRVEQIKYPLSTHFWFTLISSNSRNNWIQWSSLQAWQPQSFHHCKESGALTVIEGSSERKVKKQSNGRRKGRVGR